MEVLAYLEIALCPLDYGYPIPLNSDEIGGRVDDVPVLPTCATLPAIS